MNNRMPAYLIFLLLTFGNTMVNSQNVIAVSNMKKVMMGLDLSSHFNWDTLDTKNLYGLSPLGRIEGEISVIDGRFYVSSVDDKGNFSTKYDKNNQSPFAVYAYVSDWITIEVKDSIHNQDALQTIVEKQASILGINTEKPFPFLITGLFDTVDFHIINKPESEIEHNHDLHNKAKVHFEQSDISGQLLGFYSLHHEGVFTHRGSYVHIHFVDDAATVTGHLEDISIFRPFKMKLPIYK